MNFEYSPRVVEMSAQLHQFMDEHVWPAREEYEAIVAEDRYPEALIDGLKEKAKEAGLWNLFLPALRDDEPDEER